MEGRSLYVVTSCLAAWSACSFWGKVSGPCSFKGSLSRGVSLTETPLDRDPLDRNPIPVERSPCTLKSGRCASYWNAFLFSMRTVLLALSQSFRSVDIDVWFKRALWVSHKYTGFHLLRVQLQRASGFYEQISSLQKH